MAKQELLDYVKKASELGKTRAEIEHSLLAVGWRGDDVAEAIGILEGASQNAKNNEKNRRLGAALGKNILYFLLFFLFGIGLGGFIFSLTLKPAPVEVRKEAAGFDVKKVNDGTRISDILTIRAALEEFYKKTKNYPASLDQLGNIPQNPSGGNYAYTPIGNPAQAYILNAQLESSIQNQDLNIKDGFLTLKNQQGQK